ncbi:MAG: hypothetical protein NWE93_02065 [Candidatus Bathyarchaeota archaeon]|nr:hypothetical protein [Candidatus Bathyarchaeota archaeon]
MTQSTPRKRDKALTFWLILILAGNILFLVSQLEYVWEDFSFFFWPLKLILFPFSGVSPSIPIWGTALFLVYSSVSVGAVAALFSWRKWGFYVLSAVALAALVTCLFIGVLDLAVLVNLGGMLFLGFLLYTSVNSKNPSQTN